MMSSEEETDCFALYGATTDSKQQQLLKKQKRTRQRVDAGEPRNSYSSIPNFSSRPSFLGGGGLYGSVFNSSGGVHHSQSPTNQPAPTGAPQQPQQQQQQPQRQQASSPAQHSQAAGSQGHLGATTTGSTTAQQLPGHAAAFGFFGPPGFGPPNKMLNELFGRQVKQATDAGASPPEAGHGMTGAGLDAATANPLQPVGCEDPATAPELTQHMLREILQGRKLGALSQVSEQPTNNNSIHTNNIHNNNSIHNNNNNTTAELLKSQQQQHQRDSPSQQQQQQTPVNQSQPPPPPQQNSESARSGVVSGGEDSADGQGADSLMPADAEDSAEDAASAARAMEEAFAEAGMEPGANLDGSDCDQSLPSSPAGPRSGSVSVKEELQDALKRSPSHSPCPVLPKTESSSPTTEIKRARVENIVSSMRSSPALQPAPVNGCKKRKLYHPQQQTAHHVLQHSVVSVVNDVAMLEDEEESDEEEEYATIRQKREEKDNLKNQLDKLYQQVAVMQQKYAELSSRMGPEAIEAGDAPPSPQPQPQLPPRPHRPHAPYNGALPQVPAHEHAAAAAMYQMVNQKFYLEPERFGPPPSVGPTAVEQRLKQQQQREQQEAAARAQAHQQREQQREQQPPPPPHHPQQHSPQPQAPQPPPRQEGPQTPQPGRLGQKALTPLQDQQQQHQQHKEFEESLSALRGAVEMASSALPNITSADLQLLADGLKTQLSNYINSLIDSVMSRFIQQKKFLGKQSEAGQAAVEQLNSLNKELMLASQYLERKSPRTKVVDRGAAQPAAGPNGPRGPLNGGPPPSQQAGFSPIGALAGVAHSGPHSALTENNLNQINQLPPHARASSSIFQTPKPPAIYAMASMQQQQQQHQQQQQREHQQREQRQREEYCTMRVDRGDDRESRDSEQNEALSLVMTPKKKRHKVTDTRITPRTVSRILAQDGSSSQGGADSPPPPPPPQPRPYHAPPMLPVSLPTSVAIPNPSLHESQVFSPYSPFFNPHSGHPGQVPPAGSHHLPASPPGGGGVEIRDSPPLPHPPAILHPALLAAAQHSNPDYSHLRMDSTDRSSDCNSVNSSLLTPMHLRKAKLMFFWVRYPSSAVLKMYFPDIKFNKNNTAQLVKWFSNFREFYYIQMEKYARQAVSEGVKNVEDLQVGGDSEIYRVLNLHYNRNNHIEVWNPQVPSNFRFVVEQTLKEFFKAIQGGKDSEQSWKKSIYKVISRLDDPVPEYFKSPNFLEQLE